MNSDFVQTIDFALGFYEDISESVPDDMVVLLARAYNMMKSDNFPGWYLSGDDYQDIIAFVRRVGLDCIRYWC